MKQESICTSDAKDRKFNTLNSTAKNQTAKIVDAAVVAVVVFVFVFNSKTVCMNVQAHKERHAQRVRVEKKEKEERKAQTNMDELTCN